jgi:hypothetical protein
VDTARHASFNSRPGERDQALVGHLERGSTSLRLEQDPPTRSWRRSPHIFNESLEPHTSERPFGRRP